MHYGEVEKWGETLTNYFSSDFHHEFVKFCTNLSELLKNNGIIFWLKKIKKKWGKTQKSCWGCFLKSRLVSKNLSPKELPSEKNCGFSWDFVLTRGGLTQSQLFIKIDQNLICLGKCKSLKNWILLLFFNFLQRGFEQNSIN